MTCCACKEAHTYTAADVEERNIEDPSLTYKCPEFLQAIKGAAQRHRGTAGFNDGDGSSVAGVFWHEGGFIRDTEGRMRYFEPDPPGWYYWFDGPDQERHLRGPFNSEVEADAELESSLI